MANQQRLNVLVVDGDAEAQIQLKELLSQEGYGVTCLSEPLRAPDYAIDFAAKYPFGH